MTSYYRFTGTNNDCQCIGAKALKNSVRSCQACMPMAGPVGHRHKMNRISMTQIQLCTAKVDETFAMLIPTVAIHWSIHPSSQAFAQSECPDGHHRKIKVQHLNERFFTLWCNESSICHEGKIGFFMNVKSWSLRCLEQSIGN